jgi:hypothetical protein
MLPLFLQIDVQRAARAGGVVGLTLVDLRRDDDADTAARACYGGTDEPGLAVVRRAHGQLALIGVGPDERVRHTLAHALDACRRAVDVHAVGSVWCRVEPGATAAFSGSESDIGTRLMALADESCRVGLTPGPTVALA